MDPTRSTGRHDSLLKWKEKCKKIKRKCGLIFEFWKIRLRGGQVFFGVGTYFLLLFYKGENQVRTKNPMTPIWKKRFAKTRFLGSGIRLPIRKVPHMR